MAKQELLVPGQAVRPQNAVVTVSLPTVRSNGFTWEYNYRSSNIDALTRVNASEGALFDAQAQLVESAIRKHEALFALQELPERLGHELALRRMDRADRFRERQHVYEVNELRRLKEVTQGEAEHTKAKTELAHARTLLTDAEQQHRAQQEHGYFNYELAHKKKAVELLDIKLGEAERRAILNGHVRELKAAGTPPGDVIDEALYAARSELNASGLDCSRLDAAIEARKGKREDRG